MKSLMNEIERENADKNQLNKGTSMSIHEQSNFFDRAARYLPDTLNEESIHIMATDSQGHN